MSRLLFEARAAVLACEAQQRLVEKEIELEKLKQQRKPLTDEQEYEAIGTAGNDLLALAKRWADNEVHVYQFDNEARKIIEAVLRRASAKLREKNAQPSKPDFKAFKEWAEAAGYDTAHTHDGIKWVCLNPMAADLWKAWQAAHGKGDA